MILRARAAPPQAGWAAQYDDAGRPARARRIEPPALAAWETRYAIDALSALATATGDVRWCAPVADAVAWLARSALRPGCWARFYALGTNTPVYVAADGSRVADPGHAKPGYSWTGDFGIPALFARLGVDEHGRPARAPSAPPAVLLAGDPGGCPGDRPPMPAENLADARAQIARAGVVLAALEPTRRDPCALRAGR